MKESEQVAGLYAKLAPKLAVVLTARFRIPSDIAEDVVQELFLTLIAEKDLRESVVNLSGTEAMRYLLRAGLRRSVREMERRSYLRRAPEELVAGLLVEESPEQALDEAAHLEQIREALERLRSPYREVLEMLLVRRMTAGEIGQLLGRSRNTVYQQIHRGMQLVRRAGDGKAGCV